MAEWYNTSLSNKPMSTLGIASPRQQAEAEKIRRAIEEWKITQAVKSIDPVAYGEQWMNDPLKQIERNVYSFATDPMAATTVGKSALSMFDDNAIGSLRTQGYKSREKLIDMSIDDFLRLAEQGVDPYKASKVGKVLAEGKKFSDLPFLLTQLSEDGIANVVGHEGRHRARALRELGYDTMPVVIRDRNIRWSEQANLADLITLNHGLSLYNKKAAM